MFLINLFSPLNNKVVYIHYTGFWKEFEHFTICHMVVPQKASQTKFRVGKAYCGVPQDQQLSKKGREGSRVQSQGTSRAAMKYEEQLQVICGL